MFVYLFTRFNIFLFQSLENAVNQLELLGAVIKDIKPKVTLSVFIFKCCTIAYQSLSSGESLCLFSMLSLAPKPGDLHSSGFHLLSVPRVKTHVETHAFLVAVPTLWNSLSEHVKSSNSIVSFCHHLKTHLFRLAYPS